MSSSRFRVALALPGLLLVLASGVAHAQTGTASITGLVTDETGGALPGVTVTATNQATNVEQTAVTNQAGNYTITPVTVGIYVIRAELAGFRTSATAPIALEARQVARLDFKMAVGAVAETIQVTGVAPILQTETTSVGEVLSGNTVPSLPLNGRNTGQLTLLLPGTITYNPRGFTNIGSVNMNRPFVNGNREQTNNFTVDGLDVNETIDNRVAYQPIPDALAEISVETNNYAADVGNVGGAVINSVIKSGANQFHGNAFEFYRNSDFDANTWENNRSGAAKQERKQHIFGGTLGGRVIANKVFFFGDYQGSRQDAPGAGHRLGGAGSVAARRSVERRHADPRSAHGPAVPRQPDPARSHQPDGARDPQRPGQLPAAEPQRAGRHFRQLRRRDAAGDPRPPGRRARRLERVGQRQVLRPLFVRALRGPPRSAGVPAHPRRPATISRSTTSASTGIACSARR